MLRVTWCDRCDQSTEVEVKTIQEAIDKLRKQGWDVRRSGYGRTWLHLCPDCKEPTK